MPTPLEQLKKESDEYFTDTANRVVVGHYLRRAFALGVESKEKREGRQCMTNECPLIGAHSTEHPGCMHYKEKPAKVEIKELEKRIESLEEWRDDHQEMNSCSEKLNIVSARSFRGDDGIFRFPFKVLDDTPGGSNLGRIEWHVEALTGHKNKARYYIEKLLIFASQTRDERYAKKIFEIPCYSESITGDSIGRESFLNYVWRVMPCEVHETMVFSSYPGNKHKVLEVNVNSSIGIDIDFK